MGFIVNTEKRRIIPRWRSFDDAVMTGELNPSKGLLRKIHFNTKEYLNEQKLSWQKNKTLSFAGDLLSSAFVLGLESEFLDVAKFIIAKEEYSSSPLFKLATKVLGIGEINIKGVLKSKDDIIIDFSKYYSEIRKYKFYINKEPRNPIAWIELGRLYSLLGQLDKAKKCIDLGLHLDKNNRFIVRSASRFYHHFYKDKDYALQIVKNSEFIKNDPWLMSAEIAYSSVLERFSKMTKIGKEILDDKVFDNGSITELASAIGTVELSNGKLRSAKKYFNQSLILPNDNSLAQAEWMSNTINDLVIEDSKFNLPLAFEAKTLAKYEKGEYEDSYNYAVQWQNDEPYSTRPILTASYIAGVFLDNKKLGIQLLKEGLKINDNDVRLSNNLVYFLALNDEVEEATKIFQDNLSSVVRSKGINVDTITVVGTAGLLLYRTGYPMEGKQYYQRAIELCKKEDNDYLLAIAMCNFVREEILSGVSDDELPSLINQLSKICKDREEADVQLSYEEVISKYNAKKIGKI